MTGPWLIEDYLRTYPYNLDVPIPPAQHDITDYFLFDLKKGYCDYFATSMVVLSRLAGIPARLAIGYVTGTI
jgi:transglutaminase-like putative cysteine protease